MSNNITELFQAIPDDIDVYSSEFLNGDLSEYADAFKEDNK